MREILELVAFVVLITICLLADGLMAVYGPLGMVCRVMPLAVLCLAVAFWPEKSHH